MPLLLDFLPFESALQSLAARQVLPTALDSAGLRQLGDGFHRQNFTSAETLLTDLLDQYKADVESIINPVIEQRPDRITADNPEGNVTTGMDEATARLRAKELLQQLGYSPAPEDAGTIKDLSSDRRINLVVKTNRDIAQGAGWFIQGNDPAALDAFPAQELVRIQARERIRDWQTRFLNCARVVGDVDAVRVYSETGRMIARKDSPVWQALGDGLDGSTDTLGNPFPPFAFNSGMGVRDIGYREALKFALVKPGEAVRPQLPADLGQLLVKYLAK